jgi:hypothetical protein
MCRRVFQSVLTCAGDDGALASDPSKFGSEGGVVPLASSNFEDGLEKDAPGAYRIAVAFGQLAQLA